MAEYNVMAILTNNRVANIPTVQQLLTESGCIIKTRLGLHDSVGQSCTNEGLIILQLAGSNREIQDLEDRLNGINGVSAKNNRLSTEYMQ